MGFDRFLCSPEPMTGRPHVLLSVAVSLDGCIDDVGRERLILSNEADLDRVDEVRASVDAILVGANTIRCDDPRLLVRSGARRAARVALGRPPSPVKVTLTGTGKIAPESRFLTAGEGERIVYAPTSAAAEVRDRLRAGATVVGAGDPLDVATLLADLRRRGVRRLMVEGGSQVHTLFLASGLVDELHVVFAPFLVGQPGAPRFVNAAAFPQGPGNRMRLVETRPIGDVVLLRYVPCPGA
ncbi:5-amino-6-(5-phosphoribosylamino)uracil reductase [Pseudonocardia sp. N23]|nr:5-amino-6-(5-phosphoribosylamino)uracil reductase [Pseudonocardia sp. N23]